MLTYLGMAVFVVGNYNLARIRCGNPCLAIKFTRQIALPVFLILANVLNAERMTIVDQQRFATLTQHKLELALKPVLAGCDYEYTTRLAGLSVGCVYVRVSVV